MLQFLHEQPLPGCRLGLNHSGLQFFPVAPSGFEVKVLERHRIRPTCWYLRKSFFAFRELIVLNLRLIFKRGFSQKRCQNLTEPYRTKLQLQPILQCLGVAMLCWHSATWSRSVRQCWTFCSRIVVLNWFLQECFVNLRFDDNWCRPSWLHLYTTWHIATMPVPLFSYTALAFRLPMLNK